MTSSIFFRCKDHSVSGEEFELRYQKELDLLVTFPKPESHQLPDYYKSDNYISHTDSKKTFFDKIYQEAKTFMVNRKLNWIEKKKEKGRILDIGTGTGDFLVAAKNRGWKIFGTEPNKKAREIALKKNIDLEESSTHFLTTDFDVITMWHVLEHVPDLEKQIKELDRLLKKDGLLIIAVPNFKSYDAKKYKEFWAAYDVPRHLWHFSNKAIEKIFNREGFKIISKRGMPLDAFYVSLLSEKYKNGKPKPISGLYHGLVSNLKAISTKEYSSVVYFLQKG